MTASALLAELRARDIRVWDDGNRLRCNAPAGALTPELRDQVQECKNDILEFLHSAEALARQQRAIVPLQPCGGRTPVFAVAGHNGDVFCYRALAKCLGDDQPFYGLHPPRSRRTKRAARARGESGGVLRRADPRIPA